jgi:hypothetical protein
MHKLVSLTVLATVTTVAMAVICSNEAWAQERPADAHLVLEARKVGEGSLPDSEPKDAASIVSTLKEHHISVKIFNLIKYLEERRGKVPLYSMLENQLSLELGLFGYLGVRWRF